MGTALAGRIPLVCSHRPPGAPLGERVERCQSLQEPARSCVCGHQVYDDREPRCPLCACQDHRPRLAGGPGPVLTCLPPRALGQEDRS
jgi:hypothetical protein